jgi:prepilin-type N-terminal cleavage/methylation domain-containing protein
MRSSTNHASRHRPAASGFTLVELLVTVLIGGFVTLGLTAMLQAEFRSSSSILRFQRSSRHADQARRFMEAEAARASRVELDDGALVLHGVHPGEPAATSSYTIRYSAIPVEEMNTIDSSFRGPYVLLRDGPIYMVNNGVPELDPDYDPVSGVLLDGLAAESPFLVEEVADASGSTLGVFSLTLNLQGGAEAAIPQTFLIGVATSPAFAVLQQPKENFISNCGTVGCRNTTITVGGGSRTIQEWDTRRLTGSSPRVIQSGQGTAGIPDQVIIYFNSPRPDGTAIRRGSGTNSGSCIRTECRIVIGGVSYQVQRDTSSNAARWVDTLVFLDDVVAVPAN